MRLPECASTGCLNRLFVDWSADTDGYTNLIGSGLDGGWRLQPTVPCLVARGGAAPVTPFDAFGQARTAPVSFGAEEVESCTP